MCSIAFTAFFTALFLNVGLIHCYFRHRFLSNRNIILVLNNFRIIMMFTLRGLNLLFDELSQSIRFIYQCKLKYEKQGLLHTEIFISTKYLLFHCKSVSLLYSVTLVGKISQEKQNWKKTQKSFITLIVTRIR